MVMKGLGFKPPMHKKRGHRCVFNVEIESISCLIQQQQQTSSRKSILSGLKIAEHFNNLLSDSSNSAAPPTGILHKRVAITWKRGNKKKGKIATATFNTLTNAYEFDSQPSNTTPTIQFTATMEPLEKSNSHSDNLLELSFKRKDLKITLEEYTEESIQLSNLLDRRKLCSFEYDLSDCFTQMRHDHQRLGEKCSVTLPLMTLTSKSFSKVNMQEKKKSGSNLLMRVGKGNLFAKKTDNESSVGGLLLMKMNVTPNFVNTEDEETVNSDTYVSTDNLMTDDYASDPEEEIMIRERSNSSERVSFDIPRELVKNALSPRRTSLDIQPKVDRSDINKPLNAAVSPRAKQTQPTESIVTEKRTLVEKQVVEQAVKTDNNPEERPVETAKVESSRVEEHSANEDVKTTDMHLLSQTIVEEKSTTTVKHSPNVTPSQSPTIILSPVDMYANQPERYEEIIHSNNVSPVVVNTEVNISEHVERENGELRRKLVEVEMELQRANGIVRELTSKVSQSSDSVILLKQQLSETQLQLQQTKEEYEKKLLAEKERADALFSKCDQQSKTDQDTDLLQMQLRVLETANKNLQNDLSKLRIKLKQQESKLEALQQEKKEQVVVQQESVTTFKKDNDVEFHPVVISVFWGLVAAICTVASFPFTYHVFRANSLDSSMDMSEYIFRQVIAGFGAYTLFLFIALQISKLLKLHMNGTYLVSFLRSAPTIGLDFFAFDGDFVGNAKSSALWGVCLGFGMKFVDWLFLFRWVRPSYDLPLATQELSDPDTLTNATEIVTAMPPVVSIYTIPLWKKICYSVCTGVTDELIGRMFLFLLCIELLRRLRKYKIKHNHSIPVLDQVLSYIGSYITLDAVQVDQIIPNAPTSTGSSPSTSEEKNDPDATIIGVGLNKIVVVAMIMSSVLFGLAKCSWEMHMYPPTGLMVWIIAVVRSVFIHGCSSMVFAYMFFVQENIELAMLAHIVYEFVMQW